MKLISRLFPTLKTHLNKSTELARLMEMHGILSDVVPRPPKYMAEVKLSDGTYLEPGSEIMPSQLEKEPTVKWNYKKNTYYFLCMLDPDVPSRQNPALRHWQHWLVGNIPECNIQEGLIYTKYTKPFPAENTGLHRYIFLIYKQPEFIRFPFQILTSGSKQRRGNFSIIEVARKYKLVGPVAGNFLHSKFVI